LHRCNIKHYAKICQELLLGGQELYKKLLFECLSNSKRMVCEHSLFAVIEAFREKDSYYFYRDLLDAKNIPRYYNEIDDRSDQCFFEAFAKDLRLVSRCLDFKKRVEGIVDGDCDDEFDNPFEVERYGETEFENIKENAPTMSLEKAQQIANDNQNTFDTDMVAQICFLVSKIVSGKPSSDKLVQETIDIMVNTDTDEECMLVEVRSKLVRLAQENNIIKKRKRLTQDEIKALKKEKYQSERQQDVILSGLQNKKECLGTDFNWSTGSKVTKCIELNYDEFKRLVWFKRHSVSSFILDLVRTLIDFKAEVKGAISKQPHSIAFLFNIGTAMFQDEKGGYRKLECILPQDETLRVRALEALKDENLNKDVYDNFQFDLTLARHTLKDANFFKVFRLFYSLSNIPSNIQNNPLAPYIDKQSFMANYEKLIGFTNEEVAIRVFDALLDNHPKRVPPLLTNCKSE
jgi:hypothetical protein